MKTVYWAKYPEQSEHSISELSYRPPESILKDINPAEFFGELAGRCPSMLDECRNTFKIKSPVDLHLTFNDDFTSCNSKYKQQLPFISQLIGSIGPERIVQMSSPTYLFYCDEDLTMSQLPPYYEETDFTNGCIGVSATYNINKWFRPVKPTFKLKKNNTTIDIKMDDAICYYKFNTDEKIKLVQFDAEVFNNNSILKNILTYKFNTKHPFAPSKLIDNYNAFVQARYNKKIIKIINDNLLD
jgi:hypothetical protein